MAVPNTLFTNSAGIAVMHQTPDGEWSFVGWADKQCFLRTFGTGYHTVALWLILGSASNTSYIVLDGVSRISVLNVAK